MFLSYLVTSHNETDCLKKLLSILISNKKQDHEVVLIDDYSDNTETIKIIDSFKKDINCFQHKLDRNYGKHKNYGIEKCNGKWIFQLDADEYPTDLLIKHIDDLLNSNDNNEAIWIPRLNFFEGLTKEDVNMWGWTVTDNMVNFPDYQTRLYKNLPHIRYQRRLHEKVEGYNTHTFMPAQTEFAIVHKKTMEKQRETNIRYNKLFTMEENMGYVVDHS